MVKTVPLFFLCVFEGLDTIGNIEHVTTNESINMELLEFWVFLL